MSKNSVNYYNENKLTVNRKINHTIKTFGLCVSSLKMVIHRYIRTQR